MQCTFCGTENRPEYKFCGMCGVRLERRKVERRTRQGGLNVKCASCGHLGEPGLKFCGMCGARIDRRMQERRGGEDDLSRAGAIANAQLPPPEASRSARREAPFEARAERASPAAVAHDLPPAGALSSEPVFRHEPLRPEPVRQEPVGRQPAIEQQPISGPSFLGLNTQPEGDGEYLLEDEPSRGGLRKVLLLAIVIAILGLIFVQWRSSFKANPKSAPSKPEPASTPAGEIRTPAGADPAAKDKNPAAATNANNDSPLAKDSSDAGQKAAAENPKATVVPSAAAAPPSSAEEIAEADAPDAKTEPANEAKALAETHLPDSKPSAALLRAQQFLQGRGVPQSCEQGMLYLKAATDKSDPGAAVQMAALYSSGHCVKQDRVMAYRWFNSAHELEPANMWIQKNMDQLWSQMTPQERRLAGY